MGETSKDALRLNFDRKLKLEFHGTRVTSDAGLLAYCELDEALGLTAMIDSDLRDSRTGKKHSAQHSCFTQAVNIQQIGRLAGPKSVKVSADTQRQAHQDRSQSGQLFPLRDISNRGSGSAADALSGNT